MADETREVLIRFNIDEKGFVKGMEQMTEATEDNTDAKEKNVEETGDLSGANNALVSQLDKMTGGMASATKGVYSSIKALKTFKVALAATGIGLVVLALGALYTATERLDGPMKWMEDIFGSIEVVMGTVLDRFGMLGEALLKLFDGDFAGAWEAASSAVTGFGDAVADAWEQGDALSKQRRQMEIDEVAINTRLAERRDLQQKLRNEARMDPQNAEKALKLFIQSRDLEKKNVEDVMAREEQRRQLILAEYAADSDNYKAKIERDQALLESQRTINAAQAQYREYIMAVSESENRLAAQRKANQIELSDIRRTLNTEEEEEAEVFHDNQLKRIDEEIKAKANADKAEKAMYKLHESREKQKRDGQKQTAMEALALLSLMFGKNKDALIALAVADGIQSVGNAWNAFTDVLADSTVPAWGKIPLGIAVLTAGLAAAAKVKAAAGEMATVQLANGGWLRGKSHSQGGIPVEGEGGEFMVNKRSMADPLISSLVQSANDYGNRQFMALGGFVGGQNLLNNAIGRLPGELGDVVNSQVPVLVTEDFNIVNNRVLVTEDRTTLG